MISVDNLVVTKTYTISSIKIEVSNLVLFESCTFRTILCNIDNEIIDIKFFKIEGNDYSNWTNDNYIVEWIKNQLSY